MTASLASVRKSERDVVIERRLSSSVKGLGYWAAHDAKYAKIRKAILAPKIKEATNVK